MATHSSVLAWRIPGTGEPGELPPMGLHRVGHDWSDLAAAAATVKAMFLPVLCIDVRARPWRRLSTEELILLNCCAGEDFWESLSRLIKLVNPKGNQPWIFIRRIHAQAEVPVLWPPDVKSWLIGKDLDAGKDWRQKEKGATEDERSTDSMDINWSKLQEMLEDRGAWHAAVHGVTKGLSRLSDWTATTNEKSYNRVRLIHARLGNIFESGQPGAESGNWRKQACLHFSQLLWSMELMPHFLQSIDFSVKVRNPNLKKMFSLWRNLSISLRIKINGSKKYNPLSICVLWSIVWVYIGI